MKTYYNEIDPYAAQWVRNLIAAGLVSAGDVDERDIRDVLPSDLAGYTRCHFFAGIAVWDYALNLAGWPADRPVWTGSCPCQPFSAAGRGGGVSDERHLWPHWHHLIRERRPVVVLGEQVASKDGLGWLDLVHADLEGEGYFLGAVDLCAAGVGAPHIRQRLWFVADAADTRQRHPEISGADRYDQGALQSGGQGQSGFRQPERGGAIGIVGHADFADPAQERASDDVVGGERASFRRRAVEQPRVGTTGRDGSRINPQGTARRAHGDDAGAARADFWSDADWIACRDGKARPVEPGTFPLAHGAPARVGRLRAYGNAINAEAAAAFIGACLEVLP